MAWTVARRVFVVGTFLLIDASVTDIRIAFSVDFTLRLSDVVLIFVTHNIIDFDPQQHHFDVIWIEQEKAAWAAITESSVFKKAY